MSDSANLFAYIGADVQAYERGLAGLQDAIGVGLRVVGAAGVAAMSDKEELRAIIVELGLDPKIATGIAAAVQTASEMADWMPQVGDKYRVDFGKGHFANRLLHVRGIVDEEVVVRYWHKRKHYWVYKLEPIWYFEPGSSEPVSKVKSRKKAGATKGAT